MGLDEKRLDELDKIVKGETALYWPSYDTEFAELIRLARLGLKHNDTIEQCAKVCDRFTNETMFFDELKIDREEYLSDKCAVEIRKLKLASREEK